jgi:glutamate racemase
LSKSHIGVFDSGFGGLTVLKALLEHLPAADYSYFGDTARLPYGSKSAETVARYAVKAARFLQARGATLLVVACNTATALALPQIESGVGIPVLGVIEPGAESAARLSKNQRVVVIGTEATVSSHAYQAALSRRALKTFEKACPLLVPLIEEGWVDHPITEQVARIYLDEAFGHDFSSADVLLLGCTHYPLIKPLLSRIVPASVKIVDSAEATAHGAAALNGEHAEGEAKIGFFVTDSVEKFRRLGARFLGRPIENVQHVDLRE